MGRKQRSPSYESSEGRKNSTKNTEVLSSSVDVLRSNSANERERARMRVLSKAFVRLKTSLPWVPPDTKLSKLDTLRLASRYIAHLRRLLAVGDENAPGERLVSADQDGGGGGGQQNDFRWTADYDRMFSSEDVHPMNLVKYTGKLYYV